MNSWTMLKRILRTGFIGFLRNGFISLGAVFTMTIMLFVLATLMTTGAAFQSVLTQLQNKVDITVLLLSDAPKDKILSLRDSIAQLPEVANVTYVSREAVLQQFKKRHTNDQLTLQALDELGNNPFGATLAVRAKEISQYEGIAKFLTNETTVGSGTPIIEKINYFQNKTAIDKLTQIINASKQFGLIATIFLIIVTILIVFNTIQLAIYTTKDEIGVMQIVGASDGYVQGPFVIEGALYGMVGAFVALILLYPFAFWLGPASEALLGSFNVLTYYTSHFSWLFFVLLGTGIGLGALSSLAAVYKYLRRKESHR